MLRTPWARYSAQWSWAIVIPIAAILATILLTEFQTLVVTSLGQTSPPRWLEHSMSIGIQWLSFFVPALWLAHRYRLNPSTTFPLRRITLTETLIVCLATVGLEYLASAIQELYIGIFRLSTSVTNELHITDFSSGLMILIDSSLTPGFVEEWLFRGYLLGIFLKQLPAPVAIMLTATCFAGFHLDLEGMPTYLLCGIWFSWLRLHFNSLWPPILAHALGNAMAIVYANMDYPVNPSLEIGLGAICFLFGLWWIKGRSIAATDLPLGN
jgi:membrane protease YdiL (CAAX protease family)